MSGTEIPLRLVLISCTFFSNAVSRRFWPEYAPSTTMNDSSFCAGCPHLEQCHPKLNKVTGLIAISRSAIEKARQQRHMAEDVFQNWKRIRNGVETIPSALRNQYHVDDMPVHGRIPGKFFFGAKISATNFKKLLRQWRGLYCRSHNPLLA